jgi:glycosyltransferase involved in cell wall biosynthesis
MKADLSEDKPHETPASKILHFYPDFGSQGGIERYILSVAQSLQESKTIQPVVVCSANTPFYRQLKQSNINVYGIKTLACFANPNLRLLDPFTQIQLYWILKQEKVDAVHVHIGHFENWIFKLLGYPLIYTVHGYGNLYRLSDCGSVVKKGIKKALRHLFKAFAAKVDTMIFVSQAEQQRMTDEGYLPKTLQAICIPNGLPTQLTEPDTATALRESLAISPDTRVISFINRLDDNKNPLGFLDLAEQLFQSTEVGALKFLIAGDGPLVTQLHKKLSQSAIEKEVLLLGHRQDVPAILAASDLVVHMPKAEGFGLGVLEAMMAGRPCVTYAAGGITELLAGPDTDGCLVPAEDFEALKKRALAMLNLSAEERQVLSQALRAKAAAFDFEHFITRLTQCYQQLIQAKKPLISVIIPVYQAEHSILRAVQSVLNQSYPYFELIIIDDGSTDGSLEKLATLNDSRLKMVRQKNLGVSKARNYGVSLSKGEYLAFLDADDAWFPKKLATELQTIRQSGQPVSMAYSSYYGVDEDNRLVHLPKINLDAGNIMDAVLNQEGLMLPSTTMMHRKVFEAAGGFPTDCYHEDRVFFIIATQGFPAFPTGKRLIHYQQALTGRCRSILKNFDEALSAELSIVNSLTPILSEARIKWFRLMQIRNLLYRFLMYNYTENARELIHEIDPAMLFNNKKGILAYVSIKVNFNALYRCRMMVQFFTRFGLFYWWRYKTAPLFSENRG